MVLLLQNRKSFSKLNTVCGEFVVTTLWLSSQTSKCWLKLTSGGSKSMMLLILQKSLYFSHFLRSIFYYFLDLLLFRIGNIWCCCPSTRLRPKRSDSLAHNTITNHFKTAPVKTTMVKVFSSINIKQPQTGVIKSMLKRESISSNHKPGS